MEFIKGGAPRWSKKEEAKIIGIMDDYRNDIKGKAPNIIESITRDYANKLAQDPAFKANSRSEDAIYSHIPYMDNCLAGVEGTYRGTTKDWFGTWSRNDNSKLPNPCPVPNWKAWNKKNKD